MHLRQGLWEGDGLRLGFGQELWPELTAGLKKYFLPKNNSIILLKNKTVNIGKIFT